MYKVKKPQDFDSRNRWSQNQSHKTLAVPLGLRAEDDIVSLNLHEKAHGPHGLVAGTTGSGKIRDRTIIYFVACTKFSSI
ncbi:hypothetical protein [Lachnobacterium bovis]|uniref:hypothetical protein n=1 Tax=Lachnobacterium bovis TaxID=140626 RepID=UPI000A695AE6|nr:hypothetical protein [Lachnobacterium bovis]